MKSVRLLCVALSFCSYSLAQQTLPPDTSFQWTFEEEGRFWTKAINCGKPQFLGGAQITFGIDSHTRFPGTHSARFYTNAAFEELCNQNFSVERAEIHANETYASLGVELGSPGSTVWVGWSEMYTHLDRSHITTLFQFLSGEGSPSISINYFPGYGVALRRSRFRRNGVPGVVIFSEEEFQENVWYDFVVEMKYSYGDDGHVKVWAYKSGEKSPTSYSYNDIPRAIITGPTLHNGTTLVPAQENVPQVDLGPPRFRWGVYRHDSGDLTPDQISPDEWLMEKFLGPARMKVGDNLGQAGFDAVKTRWEPAETTEFTPNYNAQIESSKVPVLINAGGEELACFRGVYQADKESYWFGTSQTIRKIVGISSQEELFLTERSGTSFGTNISLPSGSYTVTLHFSRFLPARSGIFSVISNDREVTQVDFSQVGQEGGNQDLSFTEMIHDGLLQLRLEAFQGEASLAGITIVQDSLSVEPLIGPELQLAGLEPGAIRINAGSSSPISFGSVTFQPDIYFPTSSAEFFQEEVAVKETLWGGLYQSQRQGRSEEDSLVYQIPVEPGAYVLRLHLASVSDSQRSPIFKIYQEGIPLAAPLDIEETFGAFSAVVIQNTVFVSDSLLDLSIATVEGIPAIAGIELIPQPYFGIGSSLGGIQPYETPSLRTSNTASFRLESPSVTCSQEVFLWPNPAANEVNLSVVEGQKLDILSLAGRTVAQYTLEAGFHTLSLYRFTHGRVFCSAGKTPNTEYKS